jgi:hypothetical protein
MFMRVWNAILLPDNCAELANEVPTGAKASLLDTSRLRTAAMMGLVFCLMFVVEY